MTKQKEKIMASALDVAEYMLIRASKEEEYDPISNMKLQKLCYYALGIYSKLTKGKRLFKENIEAWQHGPVVREVYLAYKDKGRFLTPAKDYDELKLTKKENEALDMTYLNYSQFSAWRLREMTHNEDPWKLNYKENKKEVIPFEDIRDYFDKKVKFLDEEN